MRRERLFIFQLKMGLTHTFGKRFVSGWDDFESSNPIAKLRIVCEHLNVQPNFEKSPWSTAIWLMKIRNKIAHAKPQLIDVHTVISRDEYDKEMKKEPKSKIEKEITLSNAIKAFEAVKNIKEILCDNIPAEEQFGLRCDGWFRSASVIRED